LQSTQNNLASLPVVAAPEPADVSPWHTVDLYVRTWLDDDTDLFRYINEMPLGTLLKYEVQPDSARNAIIEDPKGTQRLAAFGQAVPFNYGCFPQTYRDPEKVDELYGAPGDDDPMDVLDVSTEPVGVGTVVQCRPLGAVCLIDEGRADWKVLVVNVDTKGPLSGARCVEDVESIIPGRIEQCLKWIDDFKQSSGKDEAKMHFEVHSVDEAKKLIAADHASWQKLVAEAGPEGLARGHWIRKGPGLWEALKSGPVRELKKQLAPITGLMPEPVKEVVKGQLRPLKNELKAQLKLVSARGQWVRGPLFRQRLWVPTAQVDVWKGLKESFEPLKERMPAALKKQLSPLKDELKRQIKNASGRGR